MAALCLDLFLLLFCGLVWHNGVCNVTCTTDYISTLNCSCSGSKEPVICDINAECSDELSSKVGKCVIRPPNQWCTIEPDEFYIITEADTKCTLQVTQFNQQYELTENTSHTVLLYNIIKPQKPINLTVTNSNQDFNLSWAMVYTEDENVALNGELMYRVRLRPQDDMDEKNFKVYKIREDRRYQEIQCELLQPGRVYVASVQASVNHRSSQSENIWSEWSTSAAWICPHPVDSSDIFGQKIYFCLPAVFFILILFGMLGLRKKPCLFQYIPTPQDFFKPLYHTYQGDFKKWVGPVFTFSSFDVLEKSAPLQVLSEKQQVVVPLQMENLLHPGSSGSGGSGLADWSLLSLMNPDLTKRYFLGGSSLGLTHSGGHISMDTVTVSGQEGSMADFNGIDQNARFGADEDPGLDNRGNSEPHDSQDWQLQVNNIENVERISLDSYSSNEPSDDGYPQIGLDLDTIDSGFLESDCSSPVSTDCDGGDRMDAAFLDSAAGAHSNYVKQWVAFIPASEDRSNEVQ